MFRTGLINGFKRHINTPVMITTGLITRFKSHQSTTLSRWWWCSSAMASSTLSGDERNQIVFFDLETAVPTKPGHPFAILEFGSILVCPKKLVELDSFSTLVQPIDLSLISTLSKRKSGITREAVLSAPTFSEISDDVYDILHGRIWAGHNITRFDCIKIKEAFAEIGQYPPEPKATIDTYPLLTQKFGKRAGDMKMASLATYFGLGDQTHRSLDDCRMNLEVVKHCATVLFLESSVPPGIRTDISWVSPRKSPVTRSNEKKSLSDGARESSASFSSSPKTDTSLFSVEATTEENHPIISLLTEYSDSDTSSCCESDTSDITDLISKLHIGSPQSDAVDEAKTEIQVAESTSLLDAEEESFLGVDQVSVTSISAIPLYRGSIRVKLFHNDAPLRLCCYSLKVRFGVSRKFVDHAGRPRLNIVVDVPQDLCKVLDASNDIARNLSTDSGTSSDWRPTVMRKEGYANFPTARLQISSEWNGDDANCGTHVYRKGEPLETIQKLDFSSNDFETLESVLLPGTPVDAFFSLEPYDYQQMAGIRLTARKLVIHLKK